MIPAALTVTAFGYTVPLAILLVVIALVLALLLTVSFHLTTILSIYYSVARTRKDRVRPDLRTELLDRLFSDNPAWDSWVSDRSNVEREVIEELLDEHLRELDGGDAETLRELGDALEIPERAGRRLETGDEYTHLYALTWLTLLRRPTPYLDSSFTPETPRERAAVVTLLAETDELADAATGVSILLDELDKQFSVFGQDTLYRVARDDPVPLLETARTDAHSWPEPLLQQVLAVCAHLETSIPESEGDLSWVTAALETGSETTRAAAAEALANFGWRPSVREQGVVQRGISDPSPRVRAAIYKTLTTWGDETALQTLRVALSDESDPRAFTIGTQALIECHDDTTDSGQLVGPAWDWSAEQVRYNRIARRPQQLDRFEDTQGLA